MRSCGRCGCVARGMPIMVLTDPTRRSGAPRNRRLFRTRQVSVRPAAAGPRRAAEEAPHDAGRLPPLGYRLQPQAVLQRVDCSRTAPRRMLRKRSLAVQHGQNMTSLLELLS